MAVDKKDELDPPEIVVVDAVAAQLELLARILVDGGYRTRLASSGLDALQAVAEHKPDLILLALKLPDLSGHEVCRRLRADAHSRDIPVLFIGVPRKAADKVRCFNAGGVDFLAEPLAPQGVLARIKVQLRLRVVAERLEQKVGERTKKLTAANLKLQQEIAERKRAEAALQESEEKYRNLVDNAPVGVFQSHVDGELLHLNQALATMFGFATMAEFQWTKVQGLYRCPQDRSDIIAELRAKGKLSGREVEFRTKDGRVLWTQMSATLKGEVLSGVFTDITALKLAQVALRRSEAFLDSIIEQSPYSMWISDDKGMLLRQNQACRDLLHISDADVVGKYVVLRDNIVQAQGFMPLVRRVFETGEPASFDLEYDSSQLQHLQLDNFAHVFLHVSIFAIRDADGRVTHAVIQHRDITDRKRVQAALGESEQRLLQAVRISQIGIFDHDHASNALYWSPEQHAIYGVPPDETVDLSVYKGLVHPDDAESIGASIRQAHDPAGDGLFDVEHRIVRRDGAVRWVKTRSRTFFAGEGATRHAVRTVGACQDTTEAKEAAEYRLTLERRLLQAQKLESLEVLAGGIAHDFNNILTSIVGNTELAMMSLDPQSPALANLQCVETSAARAADLAQQMLAYSGRGRFVVENVDLNRLLREMVKMLEVSISKKATIRLNLTSPLPAIQVDTTQIRQIVMNLVLNASDAIGDAHGVIELSTGSRSCDRAYLKEAWLDASIAEGEYVYLQVSDTGCGMDQGTMARIFDPFFTTKFTGRGLGMAAVHGIIRGHKGAIKVQSEPGKGSTFQVLFPAIQEPVTQPGGKGAAADWQGSGTVLLVDDEELVRQIGAGMLKTLGFDVLTACNGCEALEVYRARPDIDLVILDLTMPEMDGPETFEELCKMNRDVKVVLSSGYSASEVTKRFTGKGLAGFVQKPYRLSDLREVIRDLAWARPA